MQRRSSRTRVALGVVAAWLIVLAAGSVGAARSAPRPQAAALAAVSRLRGEGAIDAATAATDRADVARAVRLIDKLPPQRAAPVASALRQVDAVASRLDAPRALALFGQLAANDGWFARHAPPPGKTDITDAAGVVYRYFPGAAFEFHPLANFAALNGAATSKNVALTRSLADALLARAVTEPGGGIGWEYYFDYAGGAAPWLSGFAQAVAAQALARAAQLIPDQAATLLAAANGAYRTLHGRLVERLDVGPWVKLYGFSRVAVLNAQLQTVISLGDYAAASGNTAAGAFALRMRAAAAAALPRFDTGYWTYYSLARDPSPLDYQDYVVELLQALAKTDPRFAAAATRFASYQTEPPLFKLAGTGPGAVEFWVSKPAIVRIDTLGAVRVLDVDGGWHEETWTLPGQAGIYPVRLEATDWAGNSATAVALPIVRVAAQPRAKAKPKPARKARPRLAAQAQPLVVGAGLAEPSQAALAARDGFGAVRMTLVWPEDASAPAPGAVSALDRLPAGTNLVLDLYASPLPPDAPGRAELAEYAAALASEVPSLRDLIVGPPATPGGAAAYQEALAAVYDAVKQVTPTIRVAGDLDGAAAPQAALAALAAAYRASGRTAPLMDELAFQPAASAGTGLWTLASLKPLLSALGQDFAGTAQAGGVSLLLDNVSFASAIPAGERAAYGSAGASAGLSEPAQAAAYVSALATAACQPAVSAVLLDRLVDGAAAGGQSGLYYPDGNAKTSLQPVLEAVAADQASSRPCATVSAPSPTATATTNPSGQTTTATSSAATTPETTTPAAPPSVQPLAGRLSFPQSVPLKGAPVVHVGCRSACLYLVALQRASDAAPVLATRGELSHRMQSAVRLPAVPIARGDYRFSVWLVSADDPARLVVTRSAVVAAGRSP